MFIKNKILWKSFQTSWSVRNSKIFIIIAAIIIITAVTYLTLKYSPYPELQTFTSRPDSVRYYDRNGILLQITPLADGLRREKPPAFPKLAKDVFVFSEDRRFYSHHGIDFFSLLRAFCQNIRSGRMVSGASTITMQLARIIADNAGTNTNKPPLRRKTGEMINALRLEARLSKDQILEMYLLSLPFGYNAEGIATGARTFFAVELSALSPAQIFCLAVIPRRPLLYNPIENPENCITAAKALAQKYYAPLPAQIDEYDWEYAASSVRRFEYPFELPHLIRFIHNNISPNASPADGEIHLSVDLTLQHYLEEAIAGSVARLYSSRITNGAAVVIDNETCEILAYVGSADFHNTRNSGQVDGVLALNQSGSSMKPFLYAMALENGFKPTDVLADIQMNFGQEEVYIPRNFNERYNGPVLLRTALASSLNIPAVYLLYRLGVRNYSNLLFSLGFDSLEKSAEDAGLGLALGNSPVSLLELARAFSVFPRDGIYMPVTFQKENEESKMKKDLLQYRIFSADTARLICSFLSDSNARATAFGSGRSFRTSFPAMFKTGTANQYQSITALGATPRYTAGVWMGSFTGETVIGRTGSSVPAAIVRDTLVFLQERSNAFLPQNADFPPPENRQLKRVCAVSGMAPHDACISTVNEYVRYDENENPCTWHRIENGQSVTVFPAEYQSWFYAMTRQGSLDYSSHPLRIASPADGAVYYAGADSSIGIPAEVTGGEEDELHVTHNGNTFSVRRPFVFNLSCLRGINILYVKNGDEERELSFTVQ